MALRLACLVRLGAAVGILLAAFQAGAQETDGTGTSAAAPIVRAPQKPSHPAAPKRPAGADGKLDAAQARQLYYLRKQRLDQIRAQQNELTKDQRALATNRARMHARLQETAKALTLSEKRLSEIEEHLAQTRAKIKEEREKFDDKAAQMSALFVLLQGMSKRPPPVMFTHSKDALKMIRSGMVLAAFYQDVEKLAKQISDEVERLDAAEKEAELQEQRRKTEQSQNARLKSQIDLLLIENSEQLEIAEETLVNLKSASEINSAGIKSLEEMLPALDAAAKKGKAAALAQSRRGGSGCADAAWRDGGHHRLREFARASADAGAGQVAGQIRRSGQRWRGFKRNSHRNAAWRPGRIALRWHDLICRSFPLLRSTLDYRPRWGISYCDCRYGPDSSHSRPICSCGRACCNNGRGT